MTGWLDKLDKAERRLLKKAGRPRWMRPMLATLTEERFSSPEWIYERKLDGERALAIKHGDQVRLMSRNRKRICATYPELVDAMSRGWSGDFVVDGEVVAFDGQVTSFSRLQERMQIKREEDARASSVPVFYYLFDILNCDGWDLLDLPLRRRKAILKQAFPFQVPIRFTAHRNRDGEAYFREACEKGWEGLIAKRAGSAYTNGRSKDWLKFKCVKGQELVIGGFTEPQGSRTGFGALLVGYYQDGKLRYAGKVGTGYDDAFLGRFRKRLDGLARKTSPFSDDVPEQGAHWVSPRLVGEFGFTEWTSHGRLRHPRFLGLRRDKAAKDVKREDTSG